LPVANSIRADARVAGATLQVGARLSYALPLDHHAYLVPAGGLVNVNTYPIVL